MWGVARGAVEVGQAIGTEKALERGHALSGSGNRHWKHGNMERGHSVPSQV